MFVLRVLVLAAALMAPTVVAADVAPGDGGDDAPQPVVGEVVTVAGIGEAGYSGDGLAAVDARIGERARITVGPDGTLYIADASNKRLRAVSADGVIDTVPGTRAIRSPENDGPEVSGFFFSPSNVIRASAIGADGALYLAGDEDIRRVNADGEHAVIGGGGDEDFSDDGDGGDGGPATEAWIYEPTDIDVDDAGNVYVADANNRRVRKIDPEGTITTIAGGDADSDVSLSVSFGGRLDVAVDSAGTVYAATERVVYAVQPDGTTRTVVGAGEPGYTGDGGPAGEASIGEQVAGIALDDDDNLYIADADNNAVRRVDPAGVITTVRGGLSIGNDIAVGPDGDIYLVSDAEVRMIVRSGAEPDSLGGAGLEPLDEPAWADEEPGTVVTVAGVEYVADDEAEADPAEPEMPVDVADPRRIATADDGSVYYADPERHRVGSVGPDGTTGVIAGTGEAGFAGDDGPAEEAVLKSPSGVATGPDGSVYIADTGNSRVRRITPEGVISTVAGVEIPPNEDDVAFGDGGPATDAAVVRPSDVAVGADGSLYVADRGGRIRQVNPQGTISTIAGGGDRWKDKADGAPATEASLWEPEAVDVDSAGNVYFLESSQPYVRMIRPDGTLVTVAGNSYLDDREGGFAGDGAPAVDAELNMAQDLAVGPDDTVYIADTYNGRVRRIDQNGVIATVAGTGQRRDDGDGAAAVDAAVDEPNSVGVAADGTVYLASRRSGRIRTVDDTGVITTLSDLRADGADGDQPGGEREAAEVTLQPSNLDAAPDGRVYVAGMDGELDVISGPTAHRVDGVRATAVAAAPDASYVTLGFGHLHRVYPDGRKVLLAGGGPVLESPGTGQVGTALNLQSAEHVAVDDKGRIYVATRETGLLRLTPDGSVDEVVDTGDIGADGMARARGWAVGPDGKVYVIAERDGTRVIRVEPDGSTVDVAGTGETTVSGSDLGDGGPATQAAVRYASDVAVAGDGTIYLSTMDGIRRVDTDGDIMTVFDSPSETDGASTRHSAPAALAVGERGDVYFVDSSTNQVRVIVQPGEISEPFPWGWATLIGGLVLVLAAGVIGYLRRERLRALLRR